MDLQNTIINYSLDIAGLLGFVISLITLIHIFIIRRKNVTVNFGLSSSRNYFGETYFFIYSRFDNSSELPISITRVQLILNNTFYDCIRQELIAEELSYKEAGKILDTIVTHNDVLPINLNSLASHSGFLAFQVPRDKLPTGETHLTFRICTNRGKAVQKTFALHEDQKLL